MISVADLWSSCGSCLLMHCVKFINEVFQLMFQQILCQTHWLKLLSVIMLQHCWLWQRCTTNVFRRKNTMSLWLMMWKKLIKMYYVREDSIMANCLDVIVIFTYIRCHVFLLIDIFHEKIQRMSYLSTSLELKLHESCILHQLILNAKGLDQWTYWFQMHIYSNERFGYTVYKRLRKITLMTLLSLERHMLEMCNWPNFPRKENPNQTLNMNWRYNNLSELIFPM